MIFHHIYFHPFTCHWPLFSSFIHSNANYQMSQIIVSIFSPFRCCRLLCLSFIQSDVANYYLYLLLIQMSPTIVSIFYPFKGCWLLSLSLIHSDVTGYYLCILLTLFLIHLDVTNYYFYSFECHSLLLLSSIYLDVTNYYLHLLSAHM